jgi:ABC-type transport system substrate-binding protein
MPLCDVSQILVETDPEKRNQLIKKAFEIATKDYGHIPLHQQAPAWSVSKRSSSSSEPTTSSCSIGQRRNNG